MSMMAAYDLDILFLEKIRISKRPRIETRENKEQEHKRVKQEKSRKRKRETT